MATETTHYLFTKPAYTDTADVAVLNANWDSADFNLAPDGDTQYENAEAVAAHNGRTRAVHGIPDANRLVASQQLGYDPYSRVEPFPRWARGDQTVTDSTLFVTYVQPKVDIRATKFFIESHGTAAAGATLAQMSLFELLADGSLTQRVTSADQHTTLLTSTNTLYQPVFNSVSAYRLTAGLTYGVAVLLVGQTTPAVAWGANGGVSTFQPVLCNTVASQTTTPATVSAGSLVLASSMLWMGVSE